MTALIESFKIAGFRVKAVGNVEELLAKIRGLAGGLSFQVFDAERLAGRRHLEVAALHAISAFKAGCNVSRSLGMEAAVYASCQRQIGRALEAVGVKPETKAIAVLVFGEGEVEGFLERLSLELGWVRDDTVLDGWESRLGSLLKAYGISAEEFEAAREALGLEEAEVFLRLLWERMGLLAAKV
ncbi:MAG: KEOPS complex subunit Cgi121 [Candidatus Hecatellaceae archaeon]